MGKQFVQFLPHVMPPLMKSASFDPETSHVDETLGEEEETDPEWEYIDSGRKVCA